MKSTHRHWLQIGLFVVSLLVGTGLNALWAPNAEAVLPPRPTVPGASSDDDDQVTLAPTVERLFLAVSPSDRRYWSVVQWQDARGVWHDVPGWRGDISNGQISWWVEEKDFGKGPFRWMLLSEDHERLLATSASFNLPTLSRPVSVFLAANEPGIRVLKDWPVQW